MQQPSSSSRASSSLFPALPRHIKGRDAELTTLARTVLATKPTRLALVGAGGSGKSLLAAALAHRLARRFPGGIHWFRVGAWDFRTLTEMLALRFGTPRERHALVPGVRRYLAQGGERLLVLDNPEDDQAMARFLDALSGTPATFVITARRCLLAGVLVYPVTAPLITSGKSAFPRVAALTRVLRWNPLALDIADAIVSSRGASVKGLAAFLEAHGIGTVRVIDHEDDLPEVALLVAWGWTRLTPHARRMLGVLSHVEGDSVDVESLARLSRIRALADAEKAVASLEKWHLVQEPMARRYTVHAVVRHAVRRRTELAPGLLFEHYVALLEAHPDRLMMEQTHLFAAMDHAHRIGDLSSMLRIERLLQQLDEAPDAEVTPRVATSR
ncbi:MAG: transcriptional regulator, family protein [Myxococcaceae bacterium]|nr:transcriptional regulator, family protein [Myxococcaceae bacterium]